MASQVTAFGFVIGKTETPGVIRSGERAGEQYVRREVSLFTGTDVLKFRVSEDVSMARFEGQIAVNLEVSAFNNQPSFRYASDFDPQLLGSIGTQIAATAAS